MVKKTYIYALALSLCYADEVKEYNIDQIVTSASGFNQELKEAPASISVVSNKDLTEKPSRDLGEALSLVPGVSIEQSVGKVGGYGVSIRGMGSNYTLILMDGKRQNTTPAGFPNGFTEAFTGFMPPASAIERIEVIRGPASTLYGSDAIGGIINIITKKQLDTWGGSVTLDTTIQEEKRFGNLYGISLWAGGPLDEAKKWSLSLRLREAYRAGVPKTALKIPGVTKALGRGNIVGLSQSNASNLGFRVGYTQDELNYYYFDFDSGLQWYDNSQGLLGTLGAKGGYTKDIFFARNNLIFTHIGSYNNHKTDSSIQYNSTSNSSRLVTDNKSPLYGKNRNLFGQDLIAEHKSVFGLGEYNTMSAGAQFWFTSLNDRVMQNPFAYQNNLSLFVENESIFADSLFLTLGLRGSYNSVFGFHASPRAYLVYDALKDSVAGDLVIKGGISTGYQTPNVSQLIKGVYNYSCQGICPVYGNSKLKPESSINYELGFSNETNWTELSLTGFFITFNNKIQNVLVSANNPVPVLGAGTCTKTSADNGSGTSFRGCYYGANIDRAISYGLESFFSLKPLEIDYGSIGFNLAYTFNKTEQTSGKGKGMPLVGIPQHSLNSALNYTFNNFNLYLRNEFKAKQLRNSFGSKKALTEFKSANPSLSPYYNAYFLLHLGGGYQFSKNTKLNLGIYNLLNQSFVDYVEVKKTANGGKNNGTLENNYNYVREGRRYFVSLNMGF